MTARTGKCCSVAALIVLALGALASSGCSRQATVNSVEPLGPEPSLAQQAQSVREGKSNQIRLDRTLVTDDDLEQLDGLDDKLLRVNFSRTTITDLGMARLGSMQQLEQLRLASTKVSDAGAAHLDKLKHLRFLHLIDAPLTDAGLDSLHGLPSLESLYLDGARLSDEGIARFIDAMPHVHLHIDGGHHRTDPQSHEHKHEPHD